MRTINGIELHDGDLVEWRESYYKTVGTVIKGETFREERIPPWYENTFRVTGNIYSKEYKEKEEALDKSFLDLLREFLVTSGYSSKEVDVSKAKLFEMIHDLAEKPRHENTVKENEPPPLAMAQDGKEIAEKEFNDFIDKNCTCKTCAFFERELFDYFCTGVYKEEHKRIPVHGPEGTCECHEFSDKNLEWELEELQRKYLEQHREYFEEGV